MRIAVYPKTNASAGKEAEGLHLVRPVRCKLIEKMLSGGGKTITMSPSTRDRLSSKARALFEKKGVKVEIEKRQGRSLSEGSRIMDIVEMRRDFTSYREIEKKLGVAKSTAHYLIKYAKRSKLKKGKDVFYLD